jgi:DUF4097 and DUF4098 domain-containing protein YvlB
MRTKIIAALLAVLTALGGLNLFKSIKERLFPAVTQSATVEQADAVATEEITEDGRSRVRIRVRAGESESSTERARIRISDDSAVMIDRRFNVRAGQNLRINVEHSDVTIRTGDVDEAHVLVSLDSGNLDRAIEIFERMEFQVEMVGDEVRIESGSIDGNWNSGFNGGLDINVDVTIPERFNVRMETTHGDVDLDDIDGIVVLNTTHGDVSAATISGPEISLKSTHGNIEAGALRSERIDVKTSHADIEVETVESRMFSATTSHSDVRVANLSSDSDIETSHGDIEITLDGPYAAELGTSHGDVVVYAPSDLKASLDLKGAQVRVSSGFNLQGSVDKDHVVAEIGGGGSRITARTTHGSVHLRDQ